MHNFSVNIYYFKFLELKNKMNHTVFNNYFMLTKIFYNIITVISIQRWLVIIFKFYIIMYYNKFNVYYKVGIRTKYYNFSSPIPCINVQC